MQSMNIQGDNELFDFLTGAPKEFRENERIKKHQLKNGDFVHCVLWKNHFYISGTDIVKILIWRFQNAGRSIPSLKKFEEGIFSDLRNLKPGVDATLENPRSEFLEYLYKNGCIRTQKKQKVFFWFSVPHDSLFCDALERDLRRENNTSYGKFPESVPQRQEIYMAMPRKIYPPEPVLPPQLRTNRGRVDTNLVKKMLFVDEDDPDHFNNAFSMREIEAQQGFNEDYRMEDLLVDPNTKRSKRDDDKDIMGQQGGSYSMPNVQNGYQK